MSPPLLELIAEVRWDVSDGSTSVGVPGAPVQFQVVTADHEPFLQRFGDACRRLGFTYTERLLPPGMPSMPGQPAYKFSQGQESIIVQAGAGLVTVHALPPYKSWLDFSPFVEKVLRAVVDARQEGAGATFAAVSVRYIDAFGERFLRGSNPAAFAQDVLGFRLETPTAISSSRDESRPTRLALSYGYGTPDGLNAQITVSEAIVQDGEVALVLDMTVGAEGHVSAEMETTMDVLNRSRAVIHNVFIESTQTLHDVMIPQSDDDE